MPLQQNYFTPTRATLARRILLQIGAVIALVIMAVTWLSYRNMADTLRLEAVDNLRASVMASAIRLRSLMPGLYVTPMA